MESSPRARRVHFERYLGHHVDAIYALGHLENEWERAADMPEIDSALVPLWALARRFAMRKVKAQYEVHMTRLDLADFLRANPAFVPDALAKLKLMPGRHHESLSRALRPPFWQRWFGRGR